MFISPTNTKRFTLYHLEENEIYIQDFYGECTFYDYNSNENKVRDKGKFYLCSKTMVYESDNKNIPLVKLKFESMKTLPTFSIAFLIQVLIPLNSISAELLPLR